MMQGGPSTSPSCEGTALAPCWCGTMYSAHKVGDAPPNAFLMLACGREGR